MKNEIETVTERLRAQIIGISDYIFEHPELGDKEVHSAAFLTDLLRKNNFRVQMPYCGIPTAFRAEFGESEGPKIAFLPEYDALPGYGPEKKPAHACGHNWIAASTVGTALVLSKMSQPLGGTVVVMGTPAEETVGRKVDLVNAGAFRDIDAVFQMHLGENTNLNVSALAIDSWKFEFFGKASHAAAFPFLGINALDAVTLTFAGINALRQQLRPDVRIHGIITDGGETPNIIPNYAACKFYARAGDRQYLNEVSERVKNCARGAAMMTGAKLNLRAFENSYDNLRVSPVLRCLMRSNLEACGINDFCEQPELAGSTDLGNVSCHIPTFYGNIGVGNGKARVHEEKFLQYVNSDEAHFKLLQVVRAFCYSASELFTNHDLLEKIQAELK